MRACLFVTLCLVARGLTSCTLVATQQAAKQATSCLQDVRSSPEGQIVYAKLWASDASDTAAKLSDPDPLTPTERDALVQVHNNIISCRQMIISDDSRSAAWERPYWLDYFQRSDAIFNKLASRELPVGLANKLTIESNGKFQADETVESEVEVQFIAESANKTRVELEHRIAAADAEALREAVDSPRGWGSLLEIYAKKATA